MKGLKKILVTEKLRGHEVTYLRPMKFRGPWLGGVASSIKLTVSGQRFISSSLGDNNSKINYLKFTAKAYRTRLKRPDLIHMKIGDNAFECYDLFNGSFVATSSYTDRSDSRETRTYSEKVNFTQLYFKIPADILRNNIRKDDFKIVLQFPKSNYILKLKKSDKDYLEYVARICDDVPFPYDLHKKIEKSENLYDKLMKGLLYAGIITPAVILLGMVFVFNNYKIKGDYDFWIGLPSLVLLLLSSFVYFVMMMKKYGV